MSERRTLTVSVVVPVLDEAAHIDACLDAVARQTYPAIVEVIVADGGSTDGTRDLVARRRGLTVVDNPRRIQAAGLNEALRHVRGDVVVRVDGHCEIADDYVASAVAALEATGAAMVGGAMTPIAEGALRRGVAVAMASPVGAGPARFHTGGSPGWVDTVYLGAYRTDVLREVGGYAEDVLVNEDAELAIRMSAHGGVWFDPTIRSTYTPRRHLGAVARQFYRYGRSRALTVRKHPASLGWRQLAAPALVLGLLGPWRRPVALAYGAALGALVAGRAPRVGFPAAVAASGATACMHVPWGFGFLAGLVAGRRGVR